MKNTIKLAARVAKQTVGEYYSKLKTLFGKALNMDIPYFLVGFVVGFCLYCPTRIGK